MEGDIITPPRLVVVVVVVVFVLVGCSAVRGGGAGESVSTRWKDAPGLRLGCVADMTGVKPVDAGSGSAPRWDAKSAAKINGGMDDLYSRSSLSGHAGLLSATPNADRRESTAATSAHSRTMSDPSQRRSIAMRLFRSRANLSGVVATGTWLWAIMAWS